MTTLKMSQLAPLGGLSQDWTASDFAKLNPVTPIQPEGVWESPELSNSLIWDGPTQIALGLTAFDNQPLEFYQSRASGPQPIWTNFINSVDREKLLVLQMLDKIQQQLAEALSKKGS